MNIKILDSWLKEYVTTKATPKEIAEKLSLASVSIERTEKYNNDFLYDIEVTTNRPDLMSVVGLAREAATVLSAGGIPASFKAPKYDEPKGQADLSVTIKNDASLVNRICAVIMEVKVGKSPEKIKERLETSDIRSLSNIIDITNYVMRTVGHPTHVFDYDKLKTQTLVIRESRKNEKIMTLDNKEYTLEGGDIVADDGLGNIVDLLGVMGLENSVVDDTTKRILFFVNNNNPHKIRKTSMKLGIRTEAAQLNEKKIDPKLAKDALLLGIKLYEQYADGQMASKIYDIYTGVPKEKKVSITKKKLEQILGIEMSLAKAATILKDLGFVVEKNEEKINAIVPSERSDDIDIPEDLAEEIARVYGYHNLPNILPPVFISSTISFEENPFYWEKRAKDALKYWGFTEVYTYPMVSEELYEGPTDEAVTLKNPLGEDFMYMRRTLVPSLLEVVKENKKKKDIKIFEIANIYEKQDNSLPLEDQRLAGVIQKDSVNFFKVKGFIEQLAKDFGVNELTFKPLGNGGLETEILLGNKKLGEIEVLDENLINFELDFSLLINHATLKKTYTPENKFPPVIEDLSFILNEDIPTGEILKEIEKQSSLVKEVTLLDKYKNSRTFHILYQDKEKNLTTEEITKVRQKIINHLKTSYEAKLK